MEDGGWGVGQSKKNTVGRGGKKEADESTSTTTG